MPDKTKLGRSITVDAAKRKVSIEFELLTVPEASSTGKTVHVIKPGAEQVVINGEVYTLNASLGKKV